MMRRLVALVSGVRWNVARWLWRKPRDWVQGKALERLVRQGKVRWGRQPATTVILPRIVTVGRGSWKMEAKVIRCACGNPASHPQQVCPAGKVEDRGVLVEGRFTNG